MLFLILKFGPISNGFSWVKKRANYITKEVLATNNRLNQLGKDSKKKKLQKYNINAARILIWNKMIIGTNDNLEGFLIFFNFFLLKVVYKSTGCYLRVIFGVTVILHKIVG